MKSYFFTFFVLCFVLYSNLQAIDSDMIDLNCGSCYYKIRDEGNQEIDGKKHHYERYINVWVKDKKACAETLDSKGEPYEINIMRDDYSYTFYKNSKKGQKVKLNQAEKSVELIKAMDKSVSKTEKGEKKGTEKIIGKLCDVYEQYKTVDLFFVKYNYVMTSWVDKEGKTLKFKNEELKVENGTLQRNLVSLSEVVEFKKGINISNSKFDLPKDVEFGEIVLVPEKKETATASSEGKKENTQKNIKTSETEQGETTQENQQTAEEKPYKKEKSTEEKILEDAVKKGAGNVLKGVLGW